MKWGIVAAMAVLVCWALFSGWFTRRRLTLPIVMLIGGLIVGTGSLLLSLLGVIAEGLDIRVITAAINEKAAEQAVELVLAMVLFVDSFEIRRGVLGHQPRMALRLLLIALPLSALLALLLGVALFPTLSFAVILILVCLVVPTDLAPVSGLLSDERIPPRVRDVLNVESGYNDGFIAPVFVFAITLAGATSHASTPQAALGQAVPASLIALAIGAAVGVAAGLLLRLATRAGLASNGKLRYAVVAIPLLTYALTAQAHGNGFVAAFVAGVAFHWVRGDLARSEIDLCEDVTHLATAIVWFALGVGAVTVLLDAMTWQITLFSLAALTLIRIVPVLLSLLGSRFSWPERWLVASIGPRGIATMVFALLAANDITDEPTTQTILGVLVTTVVGSFLLFGPGVPLLARWYAGRAHRA